jgi:hypothetical protein
MCIPSIPCHRYELKQKVRNSQKIMVCIGFCHPHFSVWAGPVSLISPEMLRKICFLVPPLVQASGCLCLLSGVDFVKLATLRGRWLLLVVSYGPGCLQKDYPLPS